MSSSPCPFPLAAYPHVREVGPRDHSVRDELGLRPPSGGGNGVIHSIGGLAPCACKKVKTRGISEVATPSMAKPRVTGRKPPGLLFFSSTRVRSAAKRNT